MEGSRVVVATGTGGVGLAGGTPGVVIVEARLGGPGVAVELLGEGGEE